MAVVLPARTPTMTEKKAQEPWSPRPCGLACSTRKTCGRVTARAQRAITAPAEEAEEVRSPWA